MKLLVAEDDPVSRRLLELTLSKWGYQLLIVEDGFQAWEVLRQADAPQLAILDWMMPGMDGIHICRAVRELSSEQAVYLILLTAKGGKEDVIAGLEAGADDYLVKPFDRGELRARVRAGQRMIALQNALTDRVAELEEAAAHIKRLQGIIPICCYCKKIRDGDNYWQQVEAYISEHSEARFSHGFCPDCYDSILKPQLEGDGPPAPSLPQLAASNGAGSGREV
jgi:phosphoserine phosphatase RsbU/P